ncbi:MAG: histidine kinase [Candidatus Omnitrophota bacterium]
MADIKEEIKELEKKIEELKRKMPPHSTPISMMEELEELEEELHRKRELV